ncbi:MAG: hypothetical protein NZT92_20275, partial [Abditibacteriales bacterium]|nr:hypothetical protein [Abditibacteriales bacterium]MDW8367525.1 hypothetical protein [Abditibacteriales bacterium]
MKRLCHIPPKALVAYLAVFCLLLFVALRVAAAVLSPWRYPQVRTVETTRLPDLTALQKKLQERGLSATSYWELEQLTKKGRFVHALVVVTPKGTIVKAYPYRLIGKRLYMPYDPRRRDVGHQLARLLYNPRIEWSEPLGAYLTPLHTRSDVLVGRRERLIGHLIIAFQRVWERVETPSPLHPFAQQICDWADPLSLLALIGYWLLLPLWVYADARRAQMRATPWAFFTLLTNVIGLLTYLVVKSEMPPCCPQCRRELAREFAICPYCGPLLRLRLQRATRL